jgi:hypothetical protein
MHAQEEYAIVQAVSIACDEEVNMPKFLLWGKKYYSCCQYSHMVNFLYGALTFQRNVWIHEHCVAIGPKEPLQPFVEGLGEFVA